jgi:6-phosphogluconolactonase
VVLSPDEKFLLVPDLGSDKVLIFSFDRKTGNLEPNPEQPYLKLEPGSGPRHLVFHPEGDLLYVVNELSVTVASCRYDSVHGTLDLLTMKSTVEEPGPGEQFCAAIRIHPNGRFLYASTRADSSCLTVFRCGENGTINRIQVLYGVPFWPRDFNLDPSGELLLVAGERSDEIALYAIDQDEGTLEPLNKKFEIPSPGCILFLDPAGLNSKTTP